LPDIFIDHSLSRSHKKMDNEKQEQIAIIATPDMNQMKTIIEICNNYHIPSVGVTDLQQLTEHIQKKTYTMLIISDKIAGHQVYEEIIIIRNHSKDKYLPVIVVCSQFEEPSTDQIKPLLSAPFDIITYPVNLNILTCKIHLILTLDNQKKAIQKETQRSSRALSAKKSFLSSITHDIRTPLNSIIGLSDLIMGDQLASEQKEYITAIRRSGEMLLALFNSKIDYANIISDSLEIESKVFEPKKTIRKIVDMLSSFLQSKRTKLITNIDPAMPSMLIGDPARFEQIFFNILFVCIRQTINNEITLHVRVHSKKEDQIILYISVEDNNMDLSESQMHTLKDDSFTEVNHIHIGLFVVKHIIQAMGGNIGFSFNKDNHTELWCTACLLKTSLSSEMVCTEPDINKMETIPCSSLDPEDIRILLVEDSPINQMVEKKLLSKLGFTQVEIVENGEESLNILSKKDFDLVLMDIFMPVMNGLDASRLIRRQETIRNPNIPIIVLTAQDTDQLQGDFVKYGIDSFISKPLNIDKIASSIKKCFPGLKLISLDQKDNKSEQSAQSPDLPKKTRLKKEPLFDKKALLDRLDGDEALYQELAQGFMADIPIQISKIEKALDFDDLIIAGQLAHTLKGAFSNVGAQLLQKIAKDLEDDIRDNDIINIKKRIQQLKQSFNNVKKYI